MASPLQRDVIARHPSERDDPDLTGTGLLAAHPPHAHHHRHGSVGAQGSVATGEMGAVMPASSPSEAPMIKSPLAGADAAGAAGAKGVHTPGGAQQGRQRGGSSGGGAPPQGGAAGAGAGAAGAGGGENGGSETDELECYESPSAPAPCGSQPAALVHAQGLLHKAVHVWVVNGRDELLLRRRGKDLPVCPDCWDVPNAALRPGEGLREAAARALRECVGIDPQAPGTPPLEGPLLGCTHTLRTSLPGAYELAQIVEVYRMRGPLNANLTASLKPQLLGATSEAVFMPLAAAAALAHDCPASFCPWLLQELPDLQRKVLLGAGVAPAADAATATAAGAAGAGAGAAAAAASASGAPDQRDALPPDAAASLEGMEGM